MCNNFNVNFGNKQPIMHDTLINEGCLGVSPAIMELEGKSYNLKLKPGEIQLFAGELF